MTQSDLSEVLAPLLETLEFQSQLQAGLIFFLGVVAGMVFMMFLWGQFHG